MRRTFLYVLIVSVVLSALMGIIALTGGGRLRDTDWKILGSTLCVAGASILAMACSVAVERRRMRILGLAGIGSALVGFGLCLLGIWIEADDETFWRTASTLLVLAAFCAHAALLMLLTPPVGQRWIQPATLVATALLGVLLMFILWDEGHAKWLWRAVGVMAILGTAGTILAVVAQRLGRTAAGQAREESGPRCPHCGELLPKELLS